jgi:hypothetical protein
MYLIIVPNLREFDNEAHRSRKAKLLLSAATAAGKSNIDTAYDFPSMVRYAYRIFILHIYLS